MAQQAEADGMVSQDTGLWRGQQLTQDEIERYEANVNGDAIQTPEMNVCDDKENALKMALEDMADEDTSPVLLEYFIDHGTQWSKIAVKGD